VESVRCSYCGAPLEVTPDSVVAVCRYCGRPNFLLGNPAEVLAVSTLSSSDVVKKAVERTKKDLNLRWRMSAINFTSPDLYYLPLLLNRREAKRRLQSHRRRDLHKDGLRKRPAQNPDRD